MALSQAVSRFVDLVKDIPESDLEREWVWGSYESEGVRFAFFRTYEDLRELAVRLRTARDAAGNLPSEAQLILAQYHAAYLDLQSVMLGVDTDLSEQVPAPEEWSLRRIYAHIVGADLGFYVAIKFALDRYRQGQDHLAEIQDDTWLEIAGIDDSTLDATFKGPLVDLLPFHHDLHTRILADFASIPASELDLALRYWEKEHLSLRFRLHRFESHMRQHTIQAEKTLLALGHPPAEPLRLLRLVYAAQAQVEGLLIGTGSAFDGLTAEFVDRLDQRTREIARLLSG